MKLTTLKFWVFSITTIVSFGTCAQDPNLDWAHQIGGTGDDTGFSVCTDASGNIYTTGTFEGVVDFEPGAGTTNLTSSGSGDIYVQKLNSAGDLIWVKQFGGSGVDEGTMIKVDLSGNIYVLGSFQATADFDPGLGTNNLTSMGANDTFILKLFSSGNLNWVKQIGGANNIYASEHTVDGNGNIYTIGSFDGTIDFDPGVGTANLTSAAMYDIFIQKLDPSGNLLWVKQMEGTSSGNGQSISTDANGNVYSTGYFQEMFDFDPNAGTSNLTSFGITDLYVQKLDDAGNLIWIKQMGGVSAATYSFITTDINGNIYLTGSFEGTNDFDPSAGITELTSEGGMDIFVQKLDASGNLIWVQSMGSTSFDIGFDIQTDIYGYVYFTGYFSNTVDFDPGIGVNNHTSNGGIDVFIQKLDALGNLVWVASMGGIENDFGIGLHVSGDGSIYATGMFSGTADFSPGAGSTNFTSNGGTDGFLVKLNQITGIQENIFNDITVYPNPSRGQVNIDLGTLNDVTVRLFTLTGEILYQKENVNGGVYQFDMNIESGVYLIDIISDNVKQQYKLVMN